MLTTENPCYGLVVAVNSKHPDYLDAEPLWLTARAVVAGEHAVKAAGVRYLPRLEQQDDDEYKAYKARACFFNATGRLLENFMGSIFRREPVVKLPEKDPSGNLAAFRLDVDLRGSTLPGYAKRLVGEVLQVARAGSLIDWEGDAEDRAYVSMYAAEDILNWRIERLNGRNELTLVVLREDVPNLPADEQALFDTSSSEQIRVLRLVTAAHGGLEYLVEIWRPIKPAAGKLPGLKLERGKKVEWHKVETKVPQRLGQPLPQIPFVFHGSENYQADIGKLPLQDLINTNLDHYRLDADYKHGLHFTALPTAYLVGFDKQNTFKIGSPTAWVTDTQGATAGFLEFKGDGLKTFERAMDRAEQHMAVLGSRMLELSKKVGETASAIELRAAGENSVLASLVINLSASLTQVMQWVTWWHGTMTLAEAFSQADVLIQLNTDFGVKGMAAPEITALVLAWTKGAISQDTMMDQFRAGEVLPAGRTNDEERALIAAHLASLRTAPDATAAGALPPAGN